MKKVFLIGLGALGTMYAQALQKALPAGDFRVVADAGRIRRYRGEGIYANGERLDFAYVTPEGEMFDLPAGQADAAGSDEAADRERLQIVGDADSKAEAGSGEASDRNAWQGGDDGFGAGQPGAVPSDQDVLHCDQGACHCALAIVAVKTTQLARAIEDLKNLVGPDTAIMSLLNGIDSEKELGKVFGAEKVIYCVAAGMDATKIGNRLTYGNMGVLQIGERDGGVSERLRGVAALLANANIGYNVNTGMERTLWSKWVLNVGVNQASAVYGMCYGALQAEGPARDEMVAAMREAAAVATADGIPLGEDEITYWLGVIGTLSPDGMTSMRQDVLQGRKTEVEAFAGAVRKLGRKHGIPTPVNDRFFEAIRTMETGYGAT